MVAQDSFRPLQRALPARAVEEAIACYRDQRGLPFLFSAPEAGASAQSGALRAATAATSWRERQRAS